MRHPLATTLSSPLGPLTAVTDGESLVGLYFEGHHPGPVDAASWRLAGARGFALRQLCATLDAYFAGERVAFDDVPLRLRGTAFQLAVWRALRRLPYGTTVTYGELAQSLGLGRTSARAVGAANARNPVSIVVPCHRVVASTGRLAGYAGGHWRKGYLLDLESTA